MQPPEISSRQSGEPANQALDARAFNLRPGRKEDAAACGKICYEAFDRIAKKHDFPTDFPSIRRSHGPDVRNLCEPSRLFGRGRI
jgi:hypothetical protein